MIQVDLDKLNSLCVASSLYSVAIPEKKLEEIFSKEDTQFIITLIRFCPTIINELRHSKKVTENLEKNVGMMRQWLNESRITDPEKMVTNESLLFWLKEV